MEKMTEKRAKAYKMILIKEVGCCQCCGVEFDGMDLDSVHFHHIDRRTKAHNVSYLLHNKGYDIDTILTEVEKCVVLCKYCHNTGKDSYHATYRKLDEVNATTLYNYINGLA